jgi:Carbohydrate binding module (family 6)/Secretion system C-terminal sorting domain
MKRLSTLLCLLFCLYLTGYAQSETHNFVTYDTTFVNSSSDIWNAVITRPTGLFGNGPDTASRPLIIMMPGVGQMGSSDFSLLTQYGPHYWLANGWDGGVQLGNGKHYPIIISVTHVSNDYPSPWQYYIVLTYILKHYHIKAGCVYGTGLSEGSFTSGGMIEYEGTVGDHAGMKLFNALACFEGTPTTPYTSSPPSATSYPNNPWADTAYFATWATVYRGKYFYLEGSGSDNFRDGWHYANAMNHVVPKSAYFSYEDAGGGAHCCWNTMYDPSETNWTSVGTLGPYNSPSQLGTNTMGNYTGGNVYQWMLRQGDTSLVGSGTVVNPTPSANAGTNQTITLPVSSVNLAGSGSESGGSIVSYAWSKVSGPASYSFTNSNIANPVVSNLVVGAYTFQLTVTDGYGAQATSTVSVTVNQGVSTPTSSPSSYQAIPGTIQAESYANIYNAQTEATTDPGGGLDVGYIDQGSWMSYTINVASAGSYTLNFRLATAYSGAAFQVQDGSGNVLTTVTMKNSGGWQNWMDVTATAKLAAGQQTIKLVSISQANWNIDWFSAAPNSYSGGVNLPGTVQAENFINSGGGVITELTGDVGGGRDVGYINLHSWMDYAVNVQTAGIYTMSFRVASIYSSGTFALQDGFGNSYTTINVPNTGNYQVYTTVTTSISLCSGLQILRLASTSVANWNINWFSAALTYSVDGSSVTAANANTAMGASFTQDSAASVLTPGYGLTLYPNPVHDGVQLAINNSVTGKLFVQVLNPAGAVVKTFELEKELTNMQWQLSLSGLPAGVYVLHVQSETWQATRKLIKL